MNKLLTTSELNSKLNNGEHYPDVRFSKTLDTIKRWKEFRKKGSITLHFDGSGNVAKVELNQCI